MTIRKLKALLWFLGFAGFLGAGYTFYDIWEGKREARFDPRAPEYYHQLIRRDLDQVNDTGKRNAYYSEDRYQKLWQARIDGSWPAPPKVADPADAVDRDTTPVIEKLAEVVEVSMILWSADPLDRHIAIQYLKDKGAKGPREKTRSIHLSEGGVLRAPYDEPPYNGRVLEIGQQIVRFQWGDDEVELTPGLGRDGKARPLSEFSIAMAEDPTAGYDGPPADSVELGPGRWLLSGKDRNEMADNAEKILREDLIIRTVPPSQDGGRSSLQLKKVEPGSLPAKYGFQSGDRLISVNGVPMTSEAAAINWYKANPDLSAYQIVYERAGAQKSITLHVN